MYDELLINANAMMMMCLVGSITPVGYIFLKMMAKHCVGSTFDEFVSSSSALLPLAHHLL